MTTTDMTRPMVNPSNSRPPPSAPNICCMGTTCPRTSTLTPRGACPAACQRPVELADHAAQVFALDVGGHAHQPPHVVAIVFARQLALANLGHVANQELLVALSFDRNQAELGCRVHFVRGDLHLHLVADAGFRIGPEDRHHEAARRRGRDQRVGSHPRPSRRSGRPARGRRARRTSG